MERSKVREENLGESEGFLKLTGIAEERGEEQEKCIGIAEGEIPCFVYR